jgi:hypothetical protein
VAVSPSSKQTPTNPTYQKNGPTPSLVRAKTSGEKALSS